MTIPEQSPSTGTHAIVIGAGIAGLVTARVLTDHFDRVTLLDRDRLPEGPEVRKGVPQARQFHALLVGASRTIEKLFPGVDADLNKAGAPLIDASWDTLVFYPQGRLLRYRSDLIIRSCSRTLREWVIRRRLIQNNPRVRTLDECEVAGLIGSGSEVSGVQLRFRGEDRSAGAAPPSTLHADLVVDASGRDSRNVQCSRRSLPSSSSLHGRWPRGKTSAGHRPKAPDLAPLSGSPRSTSIG
jgi:2-polyprenyl-6-methoxyphenol hydroxylase-like FAD-dependent oxidoreductase